MKREMRLSRALVNLIPESVEDPGEPEEESRFFSKYCHENIADEILSKLPADAQLWIFAFGSLIWKPRFEHVEHRNAKVQGWQRSFCLGPDTRYRGNPEAPGLMLSLDLGHECEGVAYRLPAENLRDSLLHLLHNEPPISPVWVEAETEQGTVHCIAHVCPQDSIAFVGGLTDEEIADQLYVAVGMWGSMSDYLLNTVSHLEEIGIHDPYLWKMQALVAERLERLR